MKNLDLAFNKKCHKRSLQHFDSNNVIASNKFRRRQATANPIPTQDLEFANRFTRLKELVALARQVQDLESESGLKKPLNKSYSKFKHFQKVVYLLLEQPDSSLLGKIILASILSAIFLSVGQAIFLTLDLILNPSFTITCINSIILFIFGTEFALRVLSSTAFEENIASALLRPIILIDILAITPIFIEVLSSQNEVQRVVRHLGLLSFMKAMAILKLFRYVKNAYLFAKGLYKSLNSLIFLVLVIIIASFVFAIAAYFAEKSDPNSPFNKGIPTALWWAIVTLTTVGYGDIAPKTIPGRVIGGVTGIFGMLLLALPVVILGYHFEEVYNEREDANIIEQVKEKELKPRNDLNHDQKEAYFLGRRIESIEGSNKKVMGLLENSHSIYKDVSRDLKSLYKSIYANVTFGPGDRKSFQNKIQLIENTRAIKKKISIAQVYEQGFSKSEQFSEQREGDNLKGPNLDDQNNGQEDIISYGPHDIVDKIPSLVSRPSRMLQDKSKKSKQENSIINKARMLIPKIVVDKVDTEPITPVSRPGDENMLDTTPPKISMSQRFDYSPIIRVKSLCSQVEFDEDLSLKNVTPRRGHHLWGRRETIERKGDNYLNPSFSMKGSNQMDTYTLDCLTFDDLDSRGSSVIIDIPLKGR